jgi:4-hydroxyphenylpyruvate dioxygenase-like putative hemolysin
MIAEILRFHHLGMAVSRPETARRSFELLGYAIGEAVFDPGQNSYVQMCTSGSFPNVELVYSDSEESPVANLTKLHDSVVYHMCFETASIEDAVEQWRTSGVRAMRVAEGKPAPLFDNRRVAFYQVQGLGLVELLESAR